MGLDFSRPTLNPLVTACHVVTAGLFTAAASGALGSQGNQVLLGLLAAIAVCYVVARFLYHLKIVDFPFAVFVKLLIGPLLMDHATLL